MAAQARWKKVTITEIIGMTQLKSSGKTNINWSAVSASWTKSVTWLIYRHKMGFNEPENPLLARALDEQAKKRMRKCVVLSRIGGPPLALLKKLEREGDGS